jgi:Skp family chaperone for outer membrane proteins
MVSFRVLTVAVLAGLVGLVAQPAQAKSPLGGQVAGVCMLSQNQMMGQSKAGEATRQRLQVLAKQAGEKVQKDRTPLQRDIQKFRQEAQTMQPQQREDKQKSLQQRMQNVERETQELQQRLRITRARAMQRIIQAANPLVEAAYKSHHCGILLDRDSGVLGGNNANDLTDQIVKELDKKMPTITFNLAPMPQQKQGK